LLIKYYKPKNSRKNSKSKYKKKYQFQTLILNQKTFKKKKKRNNNLKLNFNQSLPQLNNREIPQKRNH
jgi:hypothetical protein